MSFTDRFRAVSTAQGEFADRVGEQVAFDESMRTYVDSIESLALGEWSATDQHRPRNNVLTFYGVGGIGKTSLLRKLADRLDGGHDSPEHWPPPIAYQSPIAHCVIDASDFDPEDTLLLLRATLMSLKSDMPAFDMCLGLYWSARHAQQDLAKVFQHRGRLSKLGDAVGIGDRIQSGVEEACANVIGTALPGGAAFAALSRLGSAVLRQRLEASVVRECPDLELLLREAPTPEMLPYYAHALAWDIERVQKRNGSRVVVFIDTYEEASRSAVAFINKFVWLLPNVLFVVGGRNSLAWASTDQDLAFQGARIWPGLVPGAQGEPRQHLVGYLSDEDRIRWLGTVLAGKCSQQVVAIAAEESRGLPVHLDLIAQHIADIALVREVEPADARGKLDVVARRVVRDLTDLQRRALLASCLYRRFDEELIRVTADLPNSGPVVELIGRPYVDHLPRGSYPYRLHELLREIFRATTGLADDQWLPEDWRRAASRGSELLRERFAKAEDPLQALEHADLLFGLISTFGFEYEWLPSVAQRLTSISNWTSEWSTKSMSGLTFPRTWATDLALGVGVIMTRQGRNRAEVSADLESLTRLHDEDARLDVVRYFLGQAQRDAGFEAESMMTMNSLLGGSMAHSAVKGIVHVHRRRGEFAKAHRFIDEYEATFQNADRVRGEVLWTEGRPSEALEKFQLAAVGASRLGDGGEEALCLASAGWCAALSARNLLAADLIARARDVLRASYQSFADLMANLAEALPQAIVGEFGPLREVEMTALQLQHTSVVAYARFARCIALAARHTTPDEVAPALGRLDASVQDGSFAYLLSIAKVVAGDEPEDGDWWDNDVVDRWLGILDKLKKGKHVG